ncbi:MAG: cyclopropane-fatty-acyl-phospholipid synthase family protein [Alphaproteobacteria bacterium]|jgi:cyclopropane-fatty-acyl-phospholipid synthase|uniref:Cyclopropane-fatty-acyl-phospholipid synthase n=1 Tax=Pseudorhizobium pelagicum TaxID=1509405 RepID=A0A922P4G9_9HYPH|nr:cyclopropane-fatty-acyl-phospholipid synthase family protein [Pseudorhizobium pelagicum]MBU1316743.1 cyclopropane-fatty-acyl-phospholipid synthase family protein [Alphaproteobacteria bacterium]KEQ06176.1 cyclopropane-fatty-acyl-phospholipid synthase [Pseudorhizobium pelagicum]KEQ09590.1 cyclopropane-fatty-acyl-phospholipid synthase [Pseudorhizobium pelagicum]MBU1548338.1 cyclopropane-fatty-acyl-phospholipid synthase family protein [Alphaproteobacteria bacterium]MBU2335900.1 cyclopropane-fat
MFPLSHMMKSFIRKGQLTVIDANGKRHVFAGTPGPEVTMRLTDKRLYRTLVFNPELAAGEAYMDGTMRFEEGSTLRDFLTLFSINRLSLGSYPLQKAIRAVKMRFRNRQQSNQKGEAQQNVAHHYDLGNAFYKLFLDDNMLYSCAYFREPTETLEQAQRNKLRLLASKLCLKEGMRVLDIGCGWGDLALYLAKLENVQVTGVTLSREQQKLASQRAQKEGLSDRVKFELRDYRDVDDRFDRIVSVGMFEHVGVQHYDEFFSHLNTLMPDDGIAVLHSIGHMSPPGMASPWLRKYIFPGAYSPALSEVFDSVERNSLWVSDLEFLRVHYATTLAHWGERFEANREQVIALYDDRFARMWEFYLISAEMMFRTGSQLVFHMQLSRTRDAAPITRDYITDKQREYIEREKSLALSL